MKSKIKQKDKDYADARRIISMTNRSRSLVYVELLYCSLLLSAYEKIIIAQWFKGDSNHNTHRIKLPVYIKCTSKTQSA